MCYEIGGLVRNPLMRPLERNHEEKESFEGEDTDDF